MAFHQFHRLILVSFFCGHRFVAVSHYLHCRSVRATSNQSIPWFLCFDPCNVLMTWFQTAIWQCAHCDQWTDPIPTVTVNEDEKGQSPTDEQQGMYRIARRPMDDSDDEDDDDESNKMNVENDEEKKGSDSVKGNKEMEHSQGMLFGIEFECNITMKFVHWNDAGKSKCGQCGKATHWWCEWEIGEGAENGKSRRYAFVVQSQCEIVRQSSQSNQEWPCSRHLTTRWGHLNAIRQMLQNHFLCLWAPWASKLVSQ